MIILFVFLTSCQTYRSIRFGVIYNKGQIEINSREISGNLNDRTVIHGYVYTLEDTFPTWETRVWVDKSEDAILTDRNGYFRIETTQNKCKIKFSYVGYTEEKLKLTTLEKNEIISVTVRLGAIIQ